MLMLPKVRSVDHELSMATALCALRPALIKTTEPPTGTRTMLGEKELSAIETSTVPEGCAACRAQPTKPNATASSAAMQRIGVLIRLSPGLHALQAASSTYGFEL